MYSAVYTETPTNPTIVKYRCVLHVTHYTSIRITRVNIYNKLCYQLTFVITKRFNLLNNFCSQADKYIINYIYIYNMMRNRNWVGNTIFLKTNVSSEKAISNAIINTYYNFN